MVGDVEVALEPFVEAGVVLVLRWRTGRLKRVHGAELSAVDRGSVHRQRCLYLEVAHDHDEAA